MAKPAKTDRQQVIDKIRTKQKSAEKRRGFMIVGVCGVIALLIVGAAAFKPVSEWWELRQFNNKDLADIGAAASVCQDVTTKKANGSSDHVPTDQPVPYEDAPPAFGPHWNEPGVAPAPMDRKLYTEDDRPALESLVHNLEHGYTILWYDDTIANDDDQVLQLRAIADKLAGTDNQRLQVHRRPVDRQGRGRQEVPRRPARRAVPLVAGRGRRRSPARSACGSTAPRCRGEALNDFMLDYPYLDSPEPDAA